MGRKMKSYGLKVGGAGAVVHQGKEDAEAAGGASYASCADCWNGLIIIFIYVSADLSPRRNEIYSDHIPCFASRS